MNYYYLISSFPVVDIDYQSNSSLEFSELFDLIERNITDQDRRLYHGLLYQNDNRNLLNIIFQEYHDMKYEKLLWPTVVPENILLGYRRNMSMLPDYMIDFLQDHSGVLSTFSLTDIELKLRKYFMDYIEKLSSPFLMQYYLWQDELERSIAHFNQRKFAFINPPVSPGLEFMGAVQGTFQYPDKKQIANDLQPLMDNGDYVGIEKTIDKYYRAFADSWTDTFSMNAVLAYTLKLMRLARWSDIPVKKEEIKTQFMHLLEDLKTRERSPKMTVV